MTNPLPRLLAYFCIALTISCRQDAGKNDLAQAGTGQVDSLIASGKKFQNNHKDSLLLVARQLGGISAKSHNANALVYSELFKADYNWLSSEYKPAMQMGVKCLADAEKYKITTIYPSVYALIGNLHKENSNYKMAFDAEEKGLHWAILNKDTTSIIALLGLKAMFTHSYHLFIHDNSNDTSINLQFTALKIAGASPKFERLRIRFYDNIAQYYLDTKDYNNAILYGNEGVALAIKYNQQRSLTYSYCWLGQAYYFKGDEVKGLSYLNLALNISRKLKEPYRTMELYGHLYDCYYSSGKYREAISLLKMSDKLRDSLQVTTNEKQISELQISHESVKKDAEIASMSHDQTIKNRLIAIALAGFLLIVVFSVILLLQYRVISRNNRIISISNDKKGKALANIAHIQAHELRKPLASIMGLINVIKANDYEFDKECLAKLEQASKQLDDKVHSVLGQIDKQGN